MSVIITKETIDGHLYKITRVNGTITKMEGTDPSPSPSPPTLEEIEVTALLAIPAATMTATQQNKLVQLIAGELYNL